MSQEPAEAKAPPKTQEQRIPDALLDAVVGATEQVARDRLVIRRAELDYKQRLARIFAKSGCFADLKGQTEEEGIARAMVKIELGEGIGFSPAESMQGIEMVQVRPSISAHLRAARMRAAGWSWPQMILTNGGCWLPLEFQGKPLLRPKLNPEGIPLLDAAGASIMEQVVVDFTKADAQLAGLMTKDNYRKNPRNMYWARAVTNAQRWYAPNVLSVNMLSTEEAQDLAPAAQESEARATITLDSFQPVPEKQEEKVPQPAVTLLDGLEEEHV